MSSLETLRDNLIPLGEYQSYGKGVGIVKFLSRIKYKISNFSMQPTNLLTLAFLALYLF